MRESDTTALAAAATLPALVAEIVVLEAEAARFHLQNLAPYDRTDKKFLPTTEEAVRRAKWRGHRITWELAPGRDPDQVQANWDALQRKLDAAREEKKLLQEIQRGIPA